MAEFQFKVGDTVYFFRDEWSDTISCKTVLAVSSSGNVSVELSRSDSRHQRPVYSPTTRYFLTLEDCKAYRESHLRKEIDYHQANIERIEKRIQKVQSL